MTEQPPDRGAPPRGRAATAAHQREALSGLRAGAADRRRFLRELVERRGGDAAGQGVAGPGAARPGVAGAPARGPGVALRELPDREVLVVEQQLLARTGDLTAAARRLVDDAGWTGTEVAALDRRVTSLRAGSGRAVDAERLRGDLADLDPPVRVSLAYLTPTRPVMKSTVTPDLPAPGEPLPSPPTAPEAGPGEPVRVVVVDTGLAVTARTDGWLEGLQEPGNTDPLDVFPRPNGRLDLSAGHGTFVAGLVAQHAPGVPVTVVRAVDSDGLADEVEVAGKVVAAVQEHLAPGGRLVVNLSLGTETLDDEPPVALAVALELVRELERSREAEVLLVAAAGNDGSTTRCWPAAFAATDGGVVAVAGLGSDGRPAAWSTHGEWVTCSAPGEAVLSTFVEGAEDPAFDPQWQEFPADAWAYWTGTSFAAPQVAARVAAAARASGGSLADALAGLLDGTPREPGFGALLGDA
ncbi:S8 family peptidase [Aquipuribacter nitratireducens]|uniref:S8 family serine peptidase n=1 Tax=Aquipuribacter nitratireducens TaxID=650104 RepID=A0ABW0GNQ2_9MICO